MPEYQFRCVYCGEIKIIEKRITDKMPEMIMCKKDHLMFRDYQGEAGSKSVIITDDFKAVKK